MKQAVTISELLKIKPDAQILHLKDGIYYTPKKLHNMGVCCCSDCGHIQDIVNQFCNGCGCVMVVLIDTEPSEPLIIVHFMERSKVSTRYYIGLAAAKMAHSGLFNTSYFVRVNSYTYQSTHIKV